MGYVNGTGPEGSPTFNVTPQTAADLNRLRDLVLERGTRLKGTTTQRDAYTTAGVAAEGQEWFDTTLGTPLIRRGSAWKREVSFRTFTTSRSGMTDGTLFLQAPVEDTTKDTEPAFTWSYNAGTGLISIEAGVYLLHAKGHPGGVTTGLAYMQLRAATQGVLARGPVIVNSDPWMTCSGVFRTDGSEGFFVEMQKATGGTSNGTGVLNITKLTTI